MADTQARDEAAFLRAILAAPDDDLPRLVYADWLEEHGKAKLAERIRRQVGNGKTFKINGLRGFQTGTASGAGNEELVTWRRGFVEGIRCGAAWWLSNGDAVCERHPVRAVALTTRPPVVPWPVSDDHLAWRLQGDPRPDWNLPLRDTRGRPLADLDKAVCEARWPGVAFTMPPEPMYYSAAEAFEAMRREDEEFRNAAGAVRGPDAARELIGLMVLRGSGRLGRPLGVSLPDPPR